MKKKNVLLIFIRIFLAILILLNMSVIFFFSAQDYQASSQASDKIGSALSTPIYGKFEDKTPWEKEEVRLEFFPIVRKLAHILEFGTLGALIYLFLLTWKGNLFLQYACALAATVLYAISDEWHQSFVNGRTSKALDVLIDASGALIFCSVLLLICCLIRKGEKNLKTTHYFLSNHRAPKLKIAVAADLHGSDPQKPLDLIKNANPDLILIPGDLMDDADLRAPEASGYTFLQKCATIAPTYYSLGNHEIACYHRGNPWRHPVPLPLTDEIRARIVQTGAHLLENESILREDGLRICALTSGINGKENKPDADTLAAFAGASGFRILLCHHPEYFVPYIRPTDIELTVCGHAHGGQWRIFGKGVYAPGQGLFPKYTSGVLDGRCVISRGLSNHAFVPRIFNAPELVMIYFGYDPTEIKK
ncbi:MAG: VanZ family protein [Clostridia bacterium]|nr:VanZ family protein [Clostridia bacterium]